MSTTIQTLLSYDQTLVRELGFLESLGYARNEIHLEKLSKDPTIDRFPDIPNVQVVWTNLSVRRKVSLLVYMEHSLSCSLYNIENQETVYFLDYMTKKGMDCRQEVRENNRFKDGDFSRYINLLARYFQGELRPTLLGKDWPDAPFDFQGQK